MANIGGVGAPGAGRVGGNLGIGGGSKCGPGGCKTDGKKMQDLIKRLVQQLMQVLQQQQQQGAQEAGGAGGAKGAGGGAKGGLSLEDLLKKLEEMLQQKGVNTKDPAIQQILQAAGAQLGAGGQQSAGGDTMGAGPVAAAAN